jgi:hypothetical protein
MVSDHGVFPMDKFKGALPKDFQKNLDKERFGTIFLLYGSGICVI